MDERKRPAYRDGALHLDGPLDHAVDAVLGELALHVAVHQDD
jgi:hypothetical protein